MKKTYIIPAVEIHAITVEGLIANSPAQPNAGVDSGQSVNANSVEVKGNSQNYDVWDDDWSK